MYSGSTTLATSAYPYYVTNAKDQEKLMNRKDGSILWDYLLGNYSIKIKQSYDDEQKIILDIISILKYHLLMSKFLAYLEENKNLLEKEGSKVLVLGNSSGDYDSVFGSMIYAYYMTQFSKVTHLPLIDCPKADMKLRFEVSQIMEEVGINYESLIYTEDIPNMFQSDFSFVLYDQNYREELTDKGVSQIIDHHAFNPDQIYAPYLIHPTGSVLTLVYYCLNPNFLKDFQDQSLLEKFTNFKKTTDRPFEEYDPEIDLIIYYGILQDCYDFNPTLKDRWSEFDRAATQRIKGSQKVKYNYDDLQRIKSSEERGLKLSFQDHFRKDNKKSSYQEVVAEFSIVYLHPDLFVKNYWKEVEEYFSSIPNTEQSACSLMFAYKNEKDQIERQLFYRTKSQKFNNVMKGIFEEMKCDRMENIEQWERWRDSSAMVSRKLLDKRMKASL